MSRDLTPESRSGSIVRIRACDLAPKFDPLGVLEKQGFHGGLTPREKIANSLACDCPKHYGAGADCTTEQHKTHISVPREVFYPWPTLHGLQVQLIEDITRNGLAIVRCRLDRDDSKRSLELPRWMLDRSACCGAISRHASFWTNVNVQCGLIAAISSLLPVRRIVVV